MGIENETEMIYNVEELEEIIEGGTDEIIDNFKSLSNEQMAITILRINTLLNYYNAGHTVQKTLDEIKRRNSNEQE